MLGRIIVCFLVFGSFFAQAEQEVIVRMKAKANLRDASAIVIRESRVAEVASRLQAVARDSQAEVLRVLDRLGLKYKSFYINNSILVHDLSDKQKLVIQSLSGVRSVRPNVKFSMQEVDLDESELGPETPEGFLETIRVTEVWEKLGVKGEGIVLGGQDTGYFWKHKALKNKYRGYRPNGNHDHKYNWHDAIRNRRGGCRANSQEPCDDKDHGTHTMGTMVGDDGGRNKIGVAPDAKWIGCRNMNDGDGTVASYLECFQFFLSPYPLGGDPVTDSRPDMAPHIVNNSWSCPRSEGCRGDEFIEVVEAYKAAGILLVAAASNDGPGCGTISNPPANYTGDLISVAAYNRYRREVASFSSRGPSPWNNRPAPSVIAPGASIRSSVTRGRNSYSSKSGTSMASPQVAGVAALLWSYRPDLIGNVEATMQIIQGSADPMTGGPNCGFMRRNDIPNASYGHGMLDAFSALTLEL